MRKFIRVILVFESSRASGEMSGTRQHKAKTSDSVGLCSAISNVIRTKITYDHAWIVREFEVHSSLSPYARLSAFVHEGTRKVGWFRPVPRW